MSFGLRNAAQTFQRFMDDILRGLNFCFAYMDNILVFSWSLEEHEQHLQALFNQLQKYEILMKHNRSEMVAVLGPNEALLYHIHTYTRSSPQRNVSSKHPRLP
jgi:hypothetical protein